jgi:hypothetical protein
LPVAATLGRQPSSRMSAWSIRSAELLLPGGGGCARYLHSVNETSRAQKKKKEQNKKKANKKRVIKQKRAKSEIIHAVDMYADVVA